MLAAPMAMNKLALMLLIAAAACGSKKKSPPEPFKGPLTVDRIVAAKDAVKPFQPWDEGLAVMKAKLGEPTKVDKNKYWWGAMQGDDCAYMYIEQEDGKKYNRQGLMVGAVMEPAKYGKDSAMMNREECLELLGKDANPEDPNAPGPADTNQVKDIVANAVKGRSKWDGKTIKVTGTVKQSGSLVVLGDPSDDKQEVKAWMKDGATPPEQGKPATLTCTIKIEHWMNGKGESSLEAGLSDCTP